MKEMVYTKERMYEILDHGTYKGFEYVISSYGTHPCAYVGIPEGNAFYNKDWTEGEIDIDCHWGINYSRKGIHGLMQDKWVLGWDYAHVGDYLGYGFDGKKWTTEEILNEVHDVIDQIINLDSNDLKQRSDK